MVPEALWPLDRAIRRITGLPAFAGNTVQMFRNGDAAYPVMLAAIREARTSIGLSSYIFRDDATGREFCDALVEAQARGVKVRVIIDGIGGGYFRAPVYRRLTAAGVPAALFMHSALPGGCRSSTCARTRNCWSSTGGSPSPAASTSPTRTASP